MPLGPPEFFKLIRSNIEPVDPVQYSELFNAAATFMFGTEVHPYYEAPNGDRTNRQLTEDHVLAEQGSTGWINGNRLVGASFYSLQSEKRRQYGIEADIAIAPAPGRQPVNLFELSTDGELFWVTDYESLRAATAEEISHLTADFALAR